MKNTKVIVILSIIILFPLSWYKLFSDSKANEKNYNNYLAVAREKSEMGITVIADEYYSKALNLYTSYDVLVERIQMYWNNKEYEKCKSLCNKLINKYPEKKQGYEILAKVYYNEKDYDEIFILKDILEKHKKSSDELNKLCKDLENEYCYATGCSFYYAGDFYNEYTIVSNKEEEKGYVNKLGKTVVSCQYKEASPFNSSGYAGVTDSKGSSYIIDKGGNKTYADPQKRNIEYIGYICLGYFPVKFEGKYYISNLDFEFSEKSYEYIGAYDGTCAPAYDGKQWFFINEKGEKISDKTYRDIILDEKKAAFCKERAFVKIDDSYIMIDHTEKQVGNEKFQEAKSFLTEEYVAVKQNDLWGYADIEGKIVIKPEYKDARSFTNGYGAVNIAGVWTFINTDNEQKVTGDFSCARSFSDSMTAFADVDGKWRMIKIIKYNH